MPQEKTTIEQLFDQLPQDDGVRYAMIGELFIHVDGVVCIQPAKHRIGEVWWLERASPWVQVTREAIYAGRYDSAKLLLRQASRRLLVTDTLKIHAVVKKYRAEQLAALDRVESNS